jgi:hypothetical protein
MKLETKEAKKLIFFFQSHYTVPLASLGSWEFFTFILEFLFF